ncbi:MAG TPA: hypothetical protein VGL58_15840, partial [Caulobacteraceae bacterium]
MLFLLNDAVFRLDTAALTPPMGSQRFGRLTFDFVRELGCELYAEEPLLHCMSPGRATRLAALIATKAPKINGALFVAPGFDCPPELVTSQFAQISFDVMAWLYKRQR